MSENKLVNVSIIFLALGLLFLALREFTSFIRPFVIALVLTFLLVPLTRISGRQKRRVQLFSGIVVLFLFVGLPILFSLVLNDSQDTSHLTNKKVVENNFNSILPEEIILFGTNINVQEIISLDKLGSIAGNLFSSMLSGLGTFFSEFMLVLLFLMFLLPTHDVTIERITKNLNKKQSLKFKKTLEEIEKNIRSYLYIKSAVSLFTAILSGVVMLIFGVKGIVLFSFLIFALNFIPNIGSVLAVGIVLISHFFTIGFSIGFIILAILLILVQFIVGNIIEPKFAGKQLDLSPVIILLSLFFWGSVWGIGGMFFAIPLTSIIKIIFTNIDSTKNYVKFLA